MLGLETQSRSIFVDLAAFAVNRPVQKISGVELDAWLRGMHFEDATARFVLPREPLS